MPNMLTDHKSQNSNSSIQKKSCKNFKKNLNKLSEFLRKNKLPSSKDDSWKYSNLSWLKQINFTYNTQFNYTYLEHWVYTLIKENNLETLPRLVCVNGHIVKPLTTLLDSSKLTVDLDAQPYSDSINNEANFLNEVNLICSDALIEFKVKKNTQAGTILILNLGKPLDSNPIAFHPRFQWILEENSTLSILELNIGEGTYFNNPVRQIFLKKNSCLEFNNFINPSPSSYLCSNFFVKLAEQARYKQFLMTKEAKFARQEVNVKLLGEWSETLFRAIQILNTHQHSDITTHFIHEAPHCTSFQNVKNILSERSKGVFQGKVCVKRQAQKTNAEQQNQTLLLSDQAEIYTKPELEIYAEDVKCSHGATVGALDDEQLFFLMSKGIPYPQAKQILTNAFVVEAIDYITDPLAKEFFNKHLNTEILEGL
ncbi:FeS cluster assembly protein SufD [Commensalibacter sp. Nvir]|nr:FeS cluster assembly protein SufD [Commensalibacter sp. Nvir]